MKIKICLILLMVSVLSGCFIFKRNKTVEQLSTGERAKLEQLLDERRKCLNYHIGMTDNRNANVKEVAELVNWKCGQYNNLITNLLYKDFGVTLGKTFVFVQKIQNDSLNEISEGVLAKRRGEDYTASMLSRSGVVGARPVYNNPLVAAQPIPIQQQSVPLQRVPSTQMVAPQRQVIMSGSPQQIRQMQIAPQNQYMMQQPTVTVNPMINPSVSAPPPLPSNLQPSYNPSNVPNYYPNAAGTMQGSVSVSGNRQQ